ncbi:MAG: DUF6452 family protein [Psychroflexus sp.]|nr:DUF6452 family protein [Psychroflexus sp.]MDR9448465.1 DUF6452 family protein [Psychroflexus sp.]
MRKVVFILLLVLTFGCQRDDLCGENFQVTPLINIEFYDIASPGELKSFNNLVLINETIGDTIAYEGGNSISIPLATDSDETKYRFIKNVGTENPSEDRLRFTYSRRDVYVSRACGFKVEFLDLQVQVLDDNPAEKWIKNTDVRKSIIQSDENIHLFMFH